MRDGRVQTYTTRDGLPGNSILALCEDSHDRLWVATDGGLVRFVDNRFETPRDMGSLAGVVVVAMLQDYDGSFWFGTLRHGLLRSVRRRDHGLHVTSAGMPDAHVTALVEDRRGTVWAGTPRGLASLRAGKVTRSLRDQAIGAMHVDRRGTVWVGTIGEGLVRIVDDVINGALEGERPVRRRRAGAVRGSRGQPLDRHRRRRPQPPAQSRRSCSTASATACRASPRRRSIRTTRAACGSARRAAGCSSSSTDAFARYTAERDRLGSDVITSLVSTDDTLWIGTDGGGVSRLRHGVHDADSGLGAALARGARASSRAHNGRLWVGTDGGLAALLARASRCKMIRTRGGLSNNSVQILHVDDKGALWVGTNGGGITHHRRHDDPPHHASRRASRATSSPHSTRKRDGSVWVGTYGGGLTRIRDGQLCHVTRGAASSTT